MADMGVTEVSATIEQLVSAMVQEELKEKAVIAPTVEDRSSLVGPGMNQISFPKAGGFTAATKAENTDLTAQVITYTTDDLALDQHKAILVKLEDFANIQAKPDVVADIVKRMSSELVLDIDTYLYTKLQAASAAAPDHRIGYANNPTDTIQETDILEARKLLNIQFADPSERFLLVSPAQEKNMLSLANFIQADRYGATDPLHNGELGRVYGFRVLVSTVVDDLKTIAYTRDAVSWAMQKAISFEQDRNLASVASEYLMHTIYGAKELQGGKHQVMVGTAA